MHAWNQFYVDQFLAVLAVGLVCWGCLERTEEHFRMTHATLTDRLLQHHMYTMGQEFVR